MTALIFFPYTVSEEEMYLFGSKVLKQNPWFLTKMSTHGTTPDQTWKLQSQIVQCAQPAKTMRRKAPPCWQHWFGCAAWWQTDSKLSLQCSCHGGRCVRKKLRCKLIQPKPEKFQCLLQQIQRFFLLKAWKVPIMSNSKLGLLQYTITILWPL